MQNKITKIILYTTLFLVLLVGLVGCTENPVLNADEELATVGVEKEKGILLATYFFPSGEAQLSDMFFDSEEDLCVYVNDMNKTEVYNASDKVILNPELSDNIKLFITDNEYNKVLWNESILYPNEGENKYLCYLVGESYSDGFNVVCIDQNEKKIADINISSILKTQISKDIVSLKILPLKDGNICILASYDYSNWAVVINPLSKKIVNSFNYTIIPKMIIENMLYGISLNGDKIISIDLVTGKIVNEIPTEINLSSINSWDESLDIDFYGEYIYMVNKNGIFKVRYDEEQFECILTLAETNYLRNNLIYKESLSKLVNEVKLKDLAATKDLGYRINVKNPTEVFVEITIPDSAGYSSARSYVRFEF